MTGKELKIELKKKSIKQEDAAKMLSISVRTLQNWFGYDELDANIMQDLHKIFGADARIELEKPLNEAELIRQLLESNRILTETNKRITERLIDALDEIVELKKTTNTAVAAPARTANAG